MTLYFVRKTGSDAAAGTSAGAAWLTVDKAANTVAAADTVYIGAGMYRELVTMDTSGTSGSVISYIADIDGSQTGDPGLVVISAYDSNSTGAARTSALNFAGKQFIEWHGTIFNGGTTAAVNSDNGGGDSNHEDVVFSNCVFLASTTESAVDIYFRAVTTPTGNGPTFDKCSFYGRLQLYVTESAVAEQDTKTTISNCLLRGSMRTATTNSVGVKLSRVAASTFGVAGIDIFNCTFDGFYYAISATLNKCTTYPLEVRNCTIIGYVDIGILGFGTAPTALQYGNCRFSGAGTSVQSATDAGGNDLTCDILMLGSIADMPLYNTLGWSPYKPYEPMMLVDGTSLNDCIDNGSATYAPADDIYGNPRPMGRADDVGAVEARARPQQEATTIRTGTYAARFEGAGYYDAMRPVDAVSTTISAYGRFDANYTGSKPTIEVFEIPGVADQSDIMTGASGAWEQVSVTFTPTSAGWVRIRLSSQDTSATGESFWDDLEVA